MSSAPAKGEDNENSTASAPSHEGDFPSAFLEEYDVYIRNLVQTQFPFDIFGADVVDLEIDEMIQLIRIKLWLTMRKRPIHYPKAYIRKMVGNMKIDVTRKRKDFPLSINEWESFTMVTR